MFILERNRMTKRNKFYKKVQKKPDRDFNFEMIYDYIPCFNGIYPSFKILYDSEELAKESDYRRLKICLADFLAGLGNLECREDADSDDINYVINSIFSQEFKTLLEKKCTMIKSDNNISLGPHILDDMKMDSHLFYKINLTTNFVLELEDYSNQIKLDEPFQDKEKLIHFFQDEKLNKIVEDYGYNPDRLSVFVLRQIAPGAADVTFKKLFYEFEEELNSKEKVYSLKEMMKISHR
jgi:hypothetical protein